MAEYEENYQLEQLREIDLEELQIEEVDEADISSCDDDESMDPRNDEDADEVGDITYNACLVSIDSYIDEAEDTHHSATFLDGGAIMNLPMFYVQVVLFPEEILPLRVTEPRFKASLERALNQNHAPGTLGVVCVHKDVNSQTLRFSAVGTIAEIQHHHLLKNGSFNVLTRGKQRFHLRHRWIDSDGAPCAEVQIIQEDMPLRTPRDAFGQLASVTNIWNSTSSYKCPNQNNNSVTSFENDLSPAELQLHRSAIKSYHLHNNRSVSSDSSPDSGNARHKLRSSKLKFDTQRKNFLAPKSFWPYWVYRMYDSYSLALRSALMWKQIIGSPCMDELARKPDILSYHIASKLPVSEAIRQKLLEIDGVSYRLRREIEILESINSVHCKICQTVITKRSEMLATKRKSPLDAYANICDYVSEIKVYYKADGLSLFGGSSNEHGWFPGYAWTVATCKGCESVMGWRFTAVNKGLVKPDTFWAIRSSQVAKSSADP